MSSSSINQSNHNYLFNVDKFNLDRIINYLDLSSRSKLSRTCHTFNQLLTNKENFCKFLYTRDLQHANVHFFKKYFSEFKIEHLFEFNYSKITRKELKSIVSDPNSEMGKMVKVAKLFKSHQFLCKSAEEDKELCALYKEQAPYCHLLANASLHLRMLETQRIIHLVRKKEISSEMSQKLIEMFSDEEKAMLNNPKYNGEKIDFDKIDLLVNDDFDLQLTDYELAVKAYTTIWKTYSVKRLDNLHTILNSPGAVFNAMTTPMFQGFCNAISLTTEPFGAFKNWYLTEVQLEAWNKTFKDRTVERLTVCLVDKEFNLDILKTFIKIICKQDTTSEITVTYMDNENHVNQQDFLSLKPQVKNKNPEWTWEVE